MALGGLDLDWVYFTETDHEVWCTNPAVDCSRAAIYAMTFHPLEECDCMEIYAFAACAQCAQQVKNFSETVQSDGWEGQDECQYNHEFIALEPISKYNWSEDE